MERSKLKVKRRERRHLRLRKKVLGTAARPRLAVYRSLAHIYGQVIDDEKGTTLLTCSTLDKALKGKLGNSSNIKAAEAVGQELGKRALQAGIETVSFDRGGFKYHGRIKALADGARKAGLKF